MHDSALAFRPAAPTDLAKVHRLIERAYRGDAARAGWTHEADLIETPRTSEAELADIIADPDNRLLTAWDGAELICTVLISRRGADGAYLGMLTVDPQLQAGGIGHRILAHAEAEAARLFGARTMTMWVITVRPELIAWYERRGYRQTGAREPFPAETDPPLEFAVLEKPLAGG